MSAPEVSPHVSPEVGAEVGPEVGAEIQRLSVVLRDAPRSRREIQTRLGLKDEKHFRLHYLQLAMAAGLVSMTLPHRPRSRAQQYRLTSAGRAWLQGLD